MVLRVGSSNMNNRSLRLDTECDVAIDATLAGNEAARPAIRSIRDGLLAEHLDTTPEEVGRAFEESGSLVAAVERLRGGGRSLRPYEVPDLNGVERYLADHEVLDPEGPDEMFEAIGKRSLFRRLRASFHRSKR
jgi:phosphatidylserine/phosphatidylglycerophosphate/cardiolipin synthase-like enzyme